MRGCGVRSSELGGNDGNGEKGRGKAVSGDGGWAGDGFGAGDCAGLGMGPCFCAGIGKGQGLEDEFGVGDYGCGGAGM